MLAHRLFARAGARAQSTATSTPRRAPSRYSSAAFLTGRFRRRLGSASPLIDTSKYPFTFATPLSPGEVTERLASNAWSVSAANTPGVSRYDGAQLAASQPCEDHWIHGTFPSPYASRSQPWLAWGIFDGHLGGETSHALSRHLVPYVANYLRSQPLDAAAEAIKAAFQALDDVFVATVPETLSDGGRWTFAERVLRLIPGTNGSCAILALLDSSTRTLRVACTGDSRAVLGRQSATSGGWETVPLSEDQSGSAPAEIARVQALHPDEDGVVKDGRVLGLMCSRAFGDGRWKWAVDVVADVKRRFHADRYRAYEEKFRSPPYITAEPEVVTVQLEKGQPAFMIIASDGLWDVMSSKQAVDLVAKWLAWRKAGMPPPAKSEPDLGQFDLTILNGEGWKFQERRTTLQDENAATHLIRNALGGAHHDMISGMLGYTPPFAREVRDDITVQVVFFE